MQGNWPEARLVPHVAGLLIRDMLGLTVEYALDEENGPNGTGASRMYTMLANDEADVALTLCPAKFWNTSRAEAVGAKCLKSSRPSTRASRPWETKATGREPDGLCPQLNVTMVRDKVVDWSTVISLYDSEHIGQLIKVIPA